jgi:hypothetical protein
MVSKKQNEEAVVTESQLPAVNFDYGTMAGSGFEGVTQDDFTMPFLNVLQPMSPECSNNPDARPGMLINSVTKELFDGKKGVVFVPVARQHVFVEWKPRDQGGGIVGRYEPTSDVVQEAKARSTQFGSYKTPTGNDLVETFYLVGYILGDKDDSEPSTVAVIPFWSTKIKVYKRLMQMLNTFKGRPPLFAHRLLINTVQEKNNSGSFYNLDIKPVNGGVGESLIAPRTADGALNPLLVFGQTLNKSVLSGERRLSDENTTQEGSDTLPF